MGILVALQILNLADSVSSADCWVGGWTPELCCSAPGAKGNPLCWDEVYTFAKCCTETEEGIQFDIRRRSFVSDMVRRGATVHFDIKHASGGRTGAVASRTLSARSTVLRVPAEQVYSIKSVPHPLADSARQENCDAHAVLALGLAVERLDPSSTLTPWIKLLPIAFANVLWFSDGQLALVNSTFFAYIVQNWFGDLQCMLRAAEAVPLDVWKGGRKADLEDLRWALSVVKTRGFAFEGTRESTMLIPLADFLNHNRIASVKTATLAEDALRFVATKTVMPGEELCIDYAQASNLEFLVRYGFRVEDNPYGGRQFDLGGEPLQAHCPSYILRYDTPDIIENTTLDCHRQARYLSFEQQFGSLQRHEQLREDRYIYHAVEEACAQLLSMLVDHQTDEDSGNWLDARGNTDGVTAVLVREIREERALLKRCAVEFGRRQIELEPRPIPPTLAEPLARLRGVAAANRENMAETRPRHTRGTMPRENSAFTENSQHGYHRPRPNSPSSVMHPSGSQLDQPVHEKSLTRPMNAGSSFSISGNAAVPHPANARGQFGAQAAAVTNSVPNHESAAASAGDVSRPAAPAVKAGGLNSFSSQVDRNKVQQLLQRLQEGAPS